MDPIVSASNCLRNVLEVKPKEKLIIICDRTYNDLGGIFEKGALNLGLRTDLISLDDTDIRHKAPPDFIKHLNDTDVDIFINILRGNTEETPFRIEIVSAERNRKVRLGHCPGLTKDMFTHGALAMSEEDYKEMNILADKILDRCTGTLGVKMTCPSGTSLEMDVSGRDFFPDIRVDWETMKWMNLPVGEVMAGPVENSLEGTLVCKHSIGGIGILDNPVTVTAKKGMAVKIEGDRDVVKRINKALDTDDMSRNVGEFAMGINHRARLVEEFLETEKTIGTSHIAFGNNADFPGGKNRSKNHMDFLIQKPTIEISSKDGPFQIMKDGKFQL